MTFGSVSLSSEQAFENLRYAPYVRFQFLSAQLNAYNEIADSNWSLHYDTARVGSLASVLGLRMSYDVAVGTATIAPTIRLEWQRQFAGSVSQGMAYTSDTSTTYMLSTAAAASSQFSGALGLMSRLANGATGGVEYLINNDNVGFHGQGVRGKMVVPF